MTGDRGDVDDRTVAVRQGRGKSTGQDQRHEEVQLKHPVPIFDVAIENAEPFLARGLGRDPDVIDERMQRAVEKPFASATKCSRSAGSARSAVIWCVQFGSRLHSGGTASREQVMMRQPASLKRLTVACPMPRLAPVNSRTLRLPLIARRPDAKSPSAAPRSPRDPDGS